MLWGTESAREVLKPYCHTEGLTRVPGVGAPGRENGPRIAGPLYLKGGGRGRRGIRTRGSWGDGGCWGRGTSQRAAGPCTLCGAAVGAGSLLEGTGLTHAMPEAVRKRECGLGRASGVRKPTQGKSVREITAEWGVGA